MAARIVAALKEKEKSSKEIVHAMHIRRTDLTKLYKNWGVDKNATDIFHTVTMEHNIIPKDSIVYIATDEHDKSFFDGTLHGRLLPG